MAELCDVEDATAEAVPETVPRPMDHQETVQPPWYNDLKLAQSAARTPALLITRQKASSQGQQANRRTVRGGGSRVLNTLPV